MSEQKTPELGDKVKDRISGFEGVATGIADYISGCRQVLVGPTQRKENGELLDSHWFDVQRIEVLEKQVIKLDNGTTPGGPQAFEPAGRR